MKDLALILLIIFSIIFSFKFKGSMVILESSPTLLPALNGTVSVYYDLNGKPYIYIEGYTKKDGTKIKGYYRSLPDKDKFNNWSTKGNINPFTGKEGYKKL